ncbi:L-lactate permease [Demequina aurantiaca]|uniref:L-lactate permease n=1 Tax=Demequina aurantiaca TaxID=676200 RepID=UPI0007861957|nr:L-lactate permease [Demequina aurantiaca]
MLTAVAAIPIVAVLLLMVVAKWSAVAAGAVAAVGAMVLALTAFDFGGEDWGFTSVEGVIGIVARAAWTALTVMLIIGPALGIHHLQQRTGATNVLERGLSRITPDPRVAALLIVWFFTMFIEGAAGFGTPVALAAPFLVAAGFKPVTAVVGALIGHATAVPFAAVGTPTLAQGALTDYSLGDLSWAVAPYQLIVGAVLAVFIARLLGTMSTEQGPPWRWMAIAYVAFFIPFLLLAKFVGPELPSLAGSLVGALVFIGVIRWVAKRRASTPVPALVGSGGEYVEIPDAIADPALELGASDSHIEPAPKESTASRAPEMSMLAAGAPYLLLVALVLVTRLVPPVRDAARSVTWSWELFGAFGESIEPFYHPGILLALAFVGGGLIQRSGARNMGQAFVDATLQLRPVFLALVAMVTVAFTMSESGMTAQLALAAAGVGAAWPFLAPAVGALGTFMTGSATASNFLFTEFQDQTAQSAGLNPLPLLGAQNSGAAVGNIICPHNVVAAAATVGLSGREGEVLKRTLPAALIAIALVGVAAYFVS